MTVLYEGLTQTCDWNFHLATVEPEKYPEPDFEFIFGDENAEHTAVPLDDFLTCKTGMGYGQVPIVVALHVTDPGVDDGDCDRITEVPSWTITGTEVQLSDNNGSGGATFPLAVGSYGGRYYSANWEAGFHQDTTADAPAPDYYRLDLWSLTSP